MNNSKRKQDEFTMTRKENNQQGFSVVEALVVVAVVGLVGVAGWFVYQHNRAQVSNAAGGGAPPTTQKATNNTTTPAPTTTYLTVKEWNVKLPLSSGATDAYYIVPVGVSLDADGAPSAILLGLNSLNSSCGVVGSTGQSSENQLGEIFRTLPTDRDPVSGETYPQLYPNGVTIGSYYYSYAGNTKTKTCASASALQSADSAFAAATKAAVSTSTTTN